MHGHAYNIGSGEWDPTPQIYTQEENVKELRKFISLAIILAVTTLGSCDFSGDAGKDNSKSDTISIMTWNMQAMFDGEDNGIEYDEYAASAGWTKEKYQARILAVSKAIGGMNVIPDIIAIQEVESEQVVDDLAASLSGHGYKWIHFANSPDMSLGVGILSRYPLIETRSHSININGDATPRPVLEVKVKADKSALNKSAADKSAVDKSNADKSAGKNGASHEISDGKSLTLFVCHWKSKLGGEAMTEETRRASARIILRRIRELAVREPDMPVIVMGDLNENYDEFYRRSGEAICALLPDDTRAFELSDFYGVDKYDAISCAELQKDFLIITRNKPPRARYFPNDAVTLYTPWTNELENGSYYYKNAWETIDHFLLSRQLFDRTNWEFDTCTVVNYPPFASTAGRPVAYNPRTGYGLSDHLPLQLFLKWEEISQ